MNKTSKRFGYLFSIELISRLLIASLSLGVKQKWIKAIKIKLKWIE